MFGHHLIDRAGAGAGVITRGWRIPHRAHAGHAVPSLATRTASLRQAALLLAINHSGAANVVLSLRIIWRRGSPVTATTATTREGEDREAKSDKSEKAVFGGHSVIPLINDLGGDYHAVR